MGRAGPISGRHTSWCCRWAVLAALTLPAAPAAGGDGYTVDTVADGTPLGAGHRIDAHALGAGGGHSAGACFALTATAGEPLAGGAQGGAFALIGGFIAAAGGPADSLFSDTFETCGAR